MGSKKCDLKGLRLALVLSHLVLATVAQAQLVPIPVDPEFQVNTTTAGVQENPAVSTDAAGNFVVVWHGAGPYVFGQRYDSSGVRLGSEFGVAAGACSDVSSDTAGNFIVVWECCVSAFDIFAQRFDSTGARRGSDFQVNTYTTDRQGCPKISADADGDFAVVWGSDIGDGSASAVFGQRFDSAGVRRGSELQGNTYTTGSQSKPGVSSDADGDLVVVWQSEAQDGSGNGVFGQRYDSTGARRGSEFRVNTLTSGHQQFPAVGSDGNGRFVVAWETDAMTPGDIQGQRYDSTGAPLGSEFQVNTFTTNRQTYPDLTRSPDGRFVVVWSSLDQDGSGGEFPSGLGVFGQVYDSAGTPQGSEFQVNTYTTGGQYYGRVASDPSGNFVVVWPSFGQDGSEVGIFSQRFALADLLDPGETLTLQGSVSDGMPVTETVPVASSEEIEIRFGLGTSRGTCMVELRVRKPDGTLLGPFVLETQEETIRTSGAAGTWTFTLTSFGGCAEQTFHVGVTSLAVALGGNLGLLVALLVCIGAALLISGMARDSAAGRRRISDIG